MSHEGAATKQPTKGQDTFVEVATGCGTSDGDDTKHLGE